LLLIRWSRGAASLQQPLAPQADDRDLKEGWWVASCRAVSLERSTQFARWGRRDQLPRSKFATTWRLC